MSFANQGSRHCLIHISYAYVSALFLIFFNLSNKREGKNEYYQLSAGN